MRVRLWLYHEGQALVIVLFCVIYPTPLFFLNDDQHVTQRCDEYTLIYLYAINIQTGSGFGYCVIYPTPLFFLNDDQHVTQRCNEYTLIYPCAINIL